MRHGRLDIETLRKFAAACGGQKAAADQLGCSPQFVYQMLSGKRPMPDAVLNRLGLRRREIVEAK